MLLIKIKPSKNRLEYYPEGENCICDSIEHSDKDFDKSLGTLVRLALYEGKSFNTTLEDCKDEEIIVLFKIE